MILKTISSCFLLVYILTFLSTAEAANTNRVLEGTFQGSNNKFQAALLINKREDNFLNKLVWYFGITPFERIASGAILNKRWVLTASALKWTSVENITVVVNDEGSTFWTNYNHDQIESAGFNRTDQAQHVMVQFWKEAGDFLLLHLAADLVFSGYGFVNIENALLPRSWLREFNAGPDEDAHADRRVFEFGFEFGFEEENVNCWVSGWSAQNQAQREVAVVVQDCPDRVDRFSIDEICVRKRQDVGFLSRMKNWLDEKINWLVDNYLPSNRFFNHFRNRNNRNAGSLLTCSMEGRLDGRRLLMGVGVGDEDVDGVFSFKRVSPHIEELNEVMIRQGDHHADQEGVGQWKRYPWLAHVWVNFAEGEPVNHVCEGIFLTTTVVITAASCLLNADGVAAVDEWIAYGFDEMDPYDHNRHILQVIDRVYPTNDGDGFDRNHAYDFHNIVMLRLADAEDREAEWFERYFVPPPNVGRDARKANGCQVTFHESVEGDRQIKFHRLKIKDTEKCISPELRPDTIEYFYSHHLCAHETSSNGVILPGSPLTCIADDGLTYLYGIASYEGYMPINWHKTYTLVGVYYPSIRQNIINWNAQYANDNQNDASEPAGSGSNDADGPDDSGSNDADGSAGSGSNDADGSAGSGSNDADGSAGSGPNDADGPDGSGFNDADGHDGSGSNDADGHDGSGSNDADGSAGSGSHDSISFESFSSVSSGSGSPDPRSSGSGSQCSSRDEDCQSVGFNRPFLNGDSFEGQDNDPFEN